MNKDFNFDKYNLNYSWDEEEYITEFTKKKETDNYIYLVCTKRGPKGYKCPGKAKFDKKNFTVYIYEKCDNNNKIHNIIMKYEQFKDKINKNSTEIIDINLKIYQKFYIQYLFEEGKINNFTEASEYFKKNFLQPNLN